MQFNSSKPQYEYLRSKWTKKHGKLQENLWSNHGYVLKNIAVSSLGGLMLLSSPAPRLLTEPATTFSRDDILKNYDKNVLLIADLREKTPDEVRPLEKAEENEIINFLSKKTNLKLTAELGGIRLNRNYGTIGGEQHLYRYPGDNIYAHADSSSDWAMYGSAGIAPHLGAWGYFASSKEEFKEIDKLRERYYLAVQTFLIPGYAENVEKYREFFKYRKMFVVNPQTGQAVVADIADAGPSEWTGKHLGGSPEIMEALGVAGGSRKGPVLYFFIDDPEDKVSLGPVKIENN